MSLTDVMDDVDYDTADFNTTQSEMYHPLCMTEGHLIYHLLKDETGTISCNRGANGEPVCSPRQLSHMCMMKLVCDPVRVLQHGSQKHVPVGLYPAMLSEAIFQRELHTIHHLVSTWPTQTLDMRSAIPTEDMLEHDILTLPVDVRDGFTILDSIMYGLLDQKPESQLKVVVFAGFKHDRKLCRELARLPLLWTPPKDRQTAHIHEILNRTIDISKDKVQRYLNRINCVYKNMDAYIKHGRKFGPITIILDCKITLDDVPIGLALQNETPFRFSCQRVWMEPITDISLPINAINSVLELRDLTHLELQDLHLCTNLESLENFSNGLLLLPSIKSISLPNSVHVGQIYNAIDVIARTLGQIPSLQKLNLASCNLRNKLGSILSRLSQGIIFLNLRDCRLTETDWTSLRLWKRLPGLRELNVSRNNMQACLGIILQIMEYIPNMTCFSVSYCSLSHQQLIRICQKCLWLRHLKMVGLQNFTPLPIDDIEELLQIIALVDTLQKCFILPDAYAFPGSDSVFRFANRERAVEMCETFLVQIGRPDVLVE